MQRPIPAEIVLGSEAQPDAEDKSQSFIDMFERASTPLGTVQRAEAALAAASALAASAGAVKGAPVKDLPKAPEVSYAADPSQRVSRMFDYETPVTLDSALGDGGGRGGGGGGGGRGGGGGGGGVTRAGASTKEKKAEPAATPGPSFWQWAPPEAPADTDGPMLQRAKPKPVQAPLPVMELEELSLLADTKPEVSLPPLQSVVDAPSWQDTFASLLAVPAGSEQTEEGATAATSQSSSVADMIQMLRATSDATGSKEASGVKEDGTRWWLESGEEEQAEGRLCKWWIMRGASADGATEWEEKWWETADEWQYKEIGAEKSGRNSTGRIWRESWSEIFSVDAVTSVQNILRVADKWAQHPDGSQWHEKWNEGFGSNGRTERDASKWGSLAPGAIPEDGHAARWTERWGETWDGRGFARKWTDKWGERDEREGGGPYRKWGDKWTQEFYEGRGGRWGETWGDDPGGAGWNSRKWSEDHFGNGQVRKWGQSTDGEYWDTTVHEDTWYEGHANFSWADAYRHSPQLMQVTPRPRREAGAGDDSGDGGNTDVFKPARFRRKT